MSSSSRDEEFEFVVQQHYQGLYRFALLLTASDAEARDLAQQAFCVWAEKRHTIRDSNKTRSWLVTTLSREFLKECRRRNRFPESVLDEGAVRAPDLTPDVICQLDAKLLCRALRGVQDRYRVPLVLFCLEGRSYLEIARTLGIPVGTVKSRISRGKRQLGAAIAVRGHPARGPG